ncbi:pilin [Acinetobacter junii]|uniref:pilin n=1 Tax=Acinetobacter junii TaxID=40215 RepID=UPI003A8754E6
MNKIQGFTIIELMITVTIIGLLAATGAPIYQGYIAKSQIISAISELNGAKPQYELIINGASTSGISGFTVPNMFFSGSQSAICIYAVNPPNSSNVANQALVCHLKNVSINLVGESVYLDRNSNGTWQCRLSSGVENKYKPKGCI